MTDDITLRSPAPDELRQFLEPLQAAFAAEFSEGEFQAERALLEADRMVNAFDREDRRIGSAAAFTMQLSVPGGEVEVSAITSVGVSPDQRRRGVLRRMLTWLLDDARAHEEAIAILWASEAAIYQRFGFGAATLGTSFEVDRSRIAFNAPIPPRDGIQFRLMTIDETMAVAPPIYEAVRSRIPGSLVRSEGRWRLILSDEEWMRRGNGPTYRAAIEVDGEPRGYAIYRVKPDWSARGPQSTLLVVEIVALDPEAEQRLWQWVCSIDLVGSIHGWRGPLPHPLQLWLQEPRRLGLTVGDGLWLRFVDVATALAARTYTREGRLVLEVEDTLIETNAGRWQLAVDAAGAATVTRTTAEPDLTLDVGTLASAYLGAHQFGDLAQAGRVRTSDPGALLAADVLFATSRSPFSNTMF